MPKGGHAHSGPAPDPKSRTSERKGGVAQTRLPADGYAGEIPELGDYLPDPTERHRAIWAQLWRTPQAAMWARDTWMIPTVADLVRCQGKLESPDAPASWDTLVRQNRTDLGLNPAGMRFLGWAIARDEVKARRDGSSSDDEGQPKRERRLRVADAQ